MPTFQMQAETPHALLFISDDSPDWTIPERDEQALASASADCVCFSVLSFVDGASLVTVTDKDCLGGKKFFNGVINSVTGRLCVSDTTSFRYLIIPVLVGSIPIEIWADDRINPTWVWIKLAAIPMSEFTINAGTPY